MMASILGNRWLLMGLRLVVGGVFIYAGVLKFQGPLAFADSIASFQLLPAELINLLALTLPPFEIAVGVLLVAGLQGRLAAFGVLVLCGVFAFAIGSALLRGIEVDCGCFGGGAPSVWKMWGSLGRDLLLAAATWLIYRAAILKMALPEQLNEGARAA